MRRARSERSRKYLAGEHDSRYLDRDEMRGIELLAKQFKLRMLGRDGREVVREIRATPVDEE